MTAFVTLIPKRYITWGLCTLYVLCTPCARFVSRARSVHRHKGCSDPKLYTFLESAWQMQSLGSVLKKIRDDFWKKNIFSSKGPPFGFSAICPTVFWPIPGVNFKLETSSFYQSSSFCEMRRHVSAWIEIQKFCSILHPYWNTFEMSLKCPWNALWTSLKYTYNSQLPWNISKASLKLPLNFLESPLNLHWNSN